MKGNIGKVKRIARDVYKSLGPGFSEGVYEQGNAGWFALDQGEI